MKFLAKTSPSWLLLTLLALGLPLAATAQSAQIAHADHEQLPPGVERQDAAAARGADIAILARQTGFSEAELDQAIAFQEEFAAYADELLARFPDQISAIWTAPAPDRRGYVRFVGEAPYEVAPEGVVLEGGGRLSLAEHARRAELAAHALTEAGHRNFLTFYDPVSDRIRVEMKLPEGAPAPRLAELFRPVEQRVWSDRELVGEALVVRPGDLDVVVVRGAGPIFELEHSRGGNWLRDDGVRECTSGWSVSGSSGDGIITAAHCTGLNQFEEPGVTPYGMTFRSQHRGTGGDVEYHTTTHVELAEFYATSTSIRSVTGIRSTSTMTGNSVCVYGRSSNSRSCSHTVEATNVTVTFSDGVTVGSLARASGDATIGGDSGGGWSYGNTAWGVHAGSGGNKSYFTPAQQAQSILGVTIKTQ